MDDLIELLRDDSDDLERQFKRATIQGKGTPQEVSDFRENALQSFIERFFPFPHRITKGKIRDSFGVCSDSIDCVVCNPIHPYTIDSKKKFQLLLADGVDLAIEVKPDIAVNNELVRGLKQGLSVKQLRRAKAPTLMALGSIIENAKRVPFFLFSMRAKKDPLETGKEIVNFYLEKHVDPLDQADAVIINNCGILMNYKKGIGFPWDIDIPYQDKSGWFFEHWDKDTLAGFLLRLHTAAHATIKMQEDVLPRYLAINQIKGVHKIV